MASALDQLCLVFIVIPASFKRFGKPCGNNTNSVLSHRVGDEHHSMLDRCQHRKTFFGVIMIAVDPFDGKHVLKSFAGHLESDAVIPPIPGGFDIVPFKKVVLHKILPTSSFVEMRPIRSFISTLT